MNLKPNWWPMGYWWMQTEEVIWMAAVDIVGYLNTALTEWSAAEKLAMLNDFCAQYGYQETIEDPEGGDPIPNPVSKKLFMNQRLVDYIKGNVNVYRKKVVEAAVVFDELDGDFEAGE